jgi:hypothetical protein
LVDSGIRVVEEGDADVYKIQCGASSVDVRVHQGQ